MDTYFLFRPELFEMDNIFGEPLHLHLIPTTLLLILALFVLLKICLKVCNPKHKVRTAKGWDSLHKFSLFRIIKLVLGIARNPKTIVQQVLRLADELPQIMRADLLGEQNVILNHPDLAELLLSSKNMGHFPKSHTANAPIVPIFGEIGLVLSEGEHWQSQRKLMSKAFTYSALRHYTKTYNKCSKRLVTKLDKKFGETDEYQQFNTILLECGLDIITETVMGLDSFIYGEEAKTIAESFNDVKYILGYRFHRWWLITMSFLWKMHPLSRKLEKKVATIESVIKTIIARYQNSVREGKVNKDEDSFDHMMELMIRSGMSERETLDEVKTMIMSGYETVNVTTLFLLFMLAVHPEHQKACRDEVDKIFDNCPEGELTMEDFSEMKYLERCFHETQRLYPVLFAITRKLEAPLRISDELELPIGANAAIPIFAYHRSPEFYPEPEKFDPDRFLPENSVKRHSHAFLGFSSGPRGCIGMKFAVLEAKAIVAHILRNFEISTRDKIEDIVLLPSLLLMPETDIYFKLKRR